MINIYALLLIFIVLVLAVIAALSILFMENDYMSETSNQAFECGFIPHYIARTPFSIQFFTITIVFLIFDLEIVILLPLTVLEKTLTVQLLTSLIVVVLMLGLIIEWYDGSLDWQL